MGTPITTCYTSAARTATPLPTPDFVNDVQARGLMLIIDTTAVGGTPPSTSFVIQVKDPISGKYFNVLTSAPITAVGTVMLKVYPGLPTVANAVANDVLPRVWRVVASHGNGNSHTYTVAAQYLF